MDLHDYTDVAENYDLYLDEMYKIEDNHAGFQEFYLDFARRYGSEDGTDGNEGIMKKRLKGTGKYIILLGIFLFIVNISMGLVLTVESSEAMKDLIRDRMLDISNTAASMIDGDTLRDIQAEDVDTPEYQEILKTLTYYQDNINLKYIYCIRDMGDKNFVFTIDPTVVDPGSFIRMPFIRRAWGQPQLIRIPMWINGEGSTVLILRCLIQIMK